MKTMMELLEESLQQNPGGRLNIIRNNQSMVMRLDDFLVKIDVSAYPGRTPNVSVDKFGPWLHRQIMNVAAMYERDGIGS